MCSLITGIDTSSNKSAKPNTAHTSETSSVDKQEDPGDGLDRHAHFDGSMTTPPTLSTTAIPSKMAIRSTTASRATASSTLTDNDRPVVYHINLSGAANFNLHFG